MMTSSNGSIFRVTGPLCGEFTGPGEFPTQRPVTRSFDVLFDLRLNKGLSKQLWGWWFETPSWSLWRECNVYNWSMAVIITFTIVFSIVFTHEAHNGDFTSAMMTSSDRNIFRVTGPLFGELTGHLTKASDAELWCFLWSTHEQVNNRDAGDLRRHPGYHDVTVMHLCHSGRKQWYCSCSGWHLLQCLVSERWTILHYGSCPKIS